MGLVVTDHFTSFFEFCRISFSVMYAFTTLISRITFVINLFIWHCACGRQVANEPGGNILIYHLNWREYTVPSTRDSKIIIARVVKYYFWWLLCRNQIIVRVSCTVLLWITHETHTSKWATMQSQVSVKACLLNKVVIRRGFFFFSDSLFHCLK